MAKRTGRRDYRVRTRVSCTFDGRLLSWTVAV
jgi:hypothetical protein